MKVDIKSISCPRCGAPISMNENNCAFCGGPIVISTFNSVNQMPMPLLKKHMNLYEKVLAEDSESAEANISIALCYLKLKLYDKAIFYFEKAIENCFDNSEVYFYFAIALLRGKKAFLTPRGEINKAIEYLNAGIAIENRGIYYYFMAYILYDHHERKGYYLQENYEYYFGKSIHLGVSRKDIDELYSILDVSKPTELSL